MVSPHMQSVSTGRPRRRPGRGSAPDRALETMSASSNTHTSGKDPSTVESATDRLIQARCEYLSDTLHPERHTDEPLEARIREVQAELEVLEQLVGETDDCTTE